MQVLTSAWVAHIGVIEGGEPYVSPMSFVVDGDRIRFRTVEGRRLRGLRASPIVSVEVSDVDPTTGDWVSVVVRGTASECHDEEEMATTVAMLLDKYRAVIGSPLSTGGMQPVAGLSHVVEVSIDEVTGMTSGRGLGPRTRPGRL
jgi:nitroimidazol reductase NimA-like FMN-containing flavoprotein (pyridoxamine 5'-phosphate oxidase superfamily)